MRFREADSNDALAVAQLHAESWRVAYRGGYSDAFLDGDVVQDRIDVWTQRLTSPPANQFVLLAEDGDELVGFVCAYGDHDDDLGSLLDNLHVRRDRHRSGTGRQLVKRTMVWCATHYPSSGMYLGVLELNVTGQKFYASLGGSHVRSEVVPEPGGGTVAVRRIAWTRDQIANVSSLH